MYRNNISALRVPRNRQKLEEKNNSYDVNIFDNLTISLYNVRRKN